MGLPRWLGPENSLCNFIKRHWLLVEGWEGSGLAAVSTGGSAWTWRQPRVPAVASGDASMSWSES